jgi:sugar lactone lactonase YvrE
LVLPGVALAQPPEGLAQPLSTRPSTVQPYLACPPAAPGHVACMSVIEPPAAKLASVSASSAFPTTEGVDGSGLAPAELQSAYKLPSASAGTGQTIAIVDAYGDPTAESDLATYRSTYGLGPCTTADGCFAKVDQTGGTHYPPIPRNEGEGAWTLETSLDVDMASAICPNCHILLVEANSSFTEDLDEAENEAVSLGATEISDSWGGNEGAEETLFDSAFDHPGIPITVASGDRGYRPGWPASNPNVIAVGGTVLTPAENARGWEERTWPDSGSGCSVFEPKPWFQTDSGCSKRTTNDVAAVAQEVSVYDTTPPPEAQPEAGPWYAVSGTSVATPIIASVEALSSSAARSLGAAAFYESPASLFHVNSGSNGVCTPDYLCTAGPGYNGPTGNGTPDGPFPAVSPAPAVTSVSPNQGPVAGGTKVTITGSHLLGTTGVDFGSVPAPSFTIVSETEITATAPPGSDSPGFGDVSVTTWFGTSPTSSADQFGYGPTITGISPSTGPITGGTKVTLRGVGFSSDGGVAQVFAVSPRVAMQSVEVPSDTEVTFVTPAAAAGTTTFEVTMNGVANQSVQVAATSTQTFQYGFPQPVVSSVSPGQGAVAGGTRVRISGSGFTGATAVLFGSSSAEHLEVLSGTEILASSPPGSDTTGYGDVTVLSPGGTSPLTTADQFIYGPTVTAISPTSGPASGGSAVTITGTGFESDGGVDEVEMNVGGASATPTVLSDTELTFITPESLPTSAGAIDTIQLRTPGPSGQAQPGDAASPSSFTYLPVPFVRDVVTPPLPVIGLGAEGAVAGGTPVRILGAGFTGATAVDFGATPASNFTVVSDTEITTTSPPGLDSTGWLDVTVLGPGGRSAVDEDDQFAYISTVTGVTPASGTETGGTPVTISGTGFESDGGVEAVVVAATESELTSVKVVSDTTLTGVMPGVRGRGETAVAVFMNGTAGQRRPGVALSSEDAYTYVAPQAPSISSLSPSSGPLAGATRVTITGNELNRVTKVLFGSVAASNLTLNSDTSLTATAPAGTAAGAVDVQVTTPAGTSAASAADRFTYTPVVSSLSPASGPVAGGTQVTIKGSGFSEATQVDFGSQPAKSLSVNSSSSITAVSPAGSDSAGWVHVTVAAGGATSAGTDADQFVYAPSITEIAPPSGPATGGTPVTIAGTGFESDGGVAFVEVGGSGEDLGSLKIVSDTTATGVMPALPAGGSTHLVFSMNGTPGQSQPARVSSQQAFNYTPALPTITTSGLPEGEVATDYAQVATAGGGAPPYTWSLAAGSLPEGLSLDASSGAITGTPTAIGTSSFTVKVTDSSAPTRQIATANLSITVTGLAYATSFSPAEYPEGKFNEPEAVAVGPSGNIWVADSGHDRVLEFNAKREYLRELGEEGTGPGQFNGIGGIATNSSGDLYVTDSANNRVQEFGPEGEHLRTLGSSIMSSGQLLDPGAVAIDSSGDVWVLNSHGGGTYSRVVEYSPSGQFLSKFGSSGSGEGQLGTAYGMTFSAGHLDVAEFANNRVQEFSTSGTYLGGFGSSGSADGQLQAPRGIAVDLRTGNLYVTDSANDRVQEFGSSGSFIAAFGSAGSSSGQFSDPTGVAVSPSGGIYVADTGNARAQEWAATDTGETPTLAASFGPPESIEGRFSEPDAVAVGSSGNVWVADSGDHRVVEFTPEGKYLRQFGTDGVGDGQFNAIEGIATDSSGDVYVTGSDRAQEFGPEGEFLRSFGSPGSGNGQFDDATGIAVDSSGNVWVLDTFNYRVQEFSPTGEYVSKFGSKGAGNGQLSWAYGLAFSDGHLDVSEFANNRVQEFSTSGVFLKQFGQNGSGADRLFGPLGIASDPRTGDVYVTELGALGSSRIQEFDASGEPIVAFGSAGSGAGEFSYPRGLAIDSSGDLYVADAGNDRVQQWLAAE